MAQEDESMIILTAIIMINFTMAYICFKSSDRGHHYSGAAAVLGLICLIGGVFLLPLILLIEVVGYIHDRNYINSIPEEYPGDEQNKPNNHCYWSEATRNGIEIGWTENHDHFIERKKKKVK